MAWRDTYKKRKDTKLMKDFIKWYADVSYASKEVGALFGLKIAIEYIRSRNIKDLWGYLIVFAETIDRQIELIGWESKNPEQTMLEYTDKFFEKGI